VTTPRERAERLVAEKLQLDINREHLKTFLLSDALAHVAEEEQGRLADQLFAMDAYSSVLTERIMFARGEHERSC